MMARRSTLMQDAELASFVRERLALKDISTIYNEMTAAYPGRTLPSRSAIGRFAIAERGRLDRRWWGSTVDGKKLAPAEPSLPFVIEADPELAMMVRSFAGRMSLETMLVICRTTFPRISLSRSELARAIMIELASRNVVKRRAIRKATVNASPQQLGG